MAVPAVVPAVDEAVNDASSVGGVVARVVWVDGTGGTVDLELGGVRKVLRCQCD
jgi:hypothetical protein